jgi:hypothetical protein
MVVLKHIYVAMVLSIGTVACLLMMWWFLIFEISEPSWFWVRLGLTVFFVMWLMISAAASKETSATETQEPGK